MRVLSFAMRTVGEAIWLPLFFIRCLMWLPMSVFTFSCIAMSATWHQKNRAVVAVRLVSWCVMSFHSLCMTSSILSAVPML